ncbi:hypothetical protein AAG906_031769 [Vitis piasezkii]
MPEMKLHIYMDSNARGSESLPQNGSTSSQSFQGERFKWVKGSGPISLAKAKIYVFKNSGQDHHFQFPSLLGQIRGFRRNLGVSRPSFEYVKIDMRQSSGMVQHFQYDEDPSATVEHRSLHQPLPQQCVRLHYSHDSLKLNVVAADNGVLINWDLTNAFSFAHHCADLVIKLGDG